MQKRRKLIAAIAAASGAVLWGNGAKASTIPWNNTGSNWGTGTDWSGNAVPGSGDTAVFSPQSGTSEVDPSLGSSTQAVSILDINNSPLGGGWTISGTTGSSLTIGSSSTTTNTSPTLVLRGTPTVTVNVPTVNILTTSNNAQYSGATVGVGSTLDLTGSTVATVTVTRAAGSPDAILLRGGTLILDNSQGNPSAQRLTATVSASGDGSVTANGGNSTLQMNGAVGGTSFTGMSQSLTDNVGIFNVAINEPAGATANTSATFGLLTQGNNSASFEFSSDGSGTLGGGGASNPSIFFTTTPTLSSGVISAAPSKAQPYAIVTTTSGGVVSGTFANYSTSVGVVAATLTTVTGASSLASASTASNVLLSPASTTTTMSANASVNTLSISPTGSGQSLALGSNTVTTAGVLLTGGTNFSITGTGGIGDGAQSKPSGVSSFFITNPSTTLSVSNPLYTTGDTTVAMLGPGILDLTGTSNQFPSSATVELGGGTLEATISGASANLVFSSVGLVRMRGGVLEVDSTSGGSTLSAAVGTAAGNINWGTNAGPTGNTGSGGFSAVGGPLSVNLGGSNGTLTWGSQSATAVGGNTPFNFVQDGYSLIFGSPDSNNTVVWDNPLALDSGTAGAYAVRDIQVIAGTGVAADKTQIAAPITGSSSTDLMKTGNGVLELNSTSNTYAGNTYLQGGTLLVTNASGSATGTGNVIMNGAALASGAGSTGIISGAVIDASGNNTIAPGGSSLGDLSIGSLQLNGANLDFSQTSTPSSHDQITLTGSGSDLSATSSNSVIVPSGLPGGIYHLITGVGSASATTSNFALATSNPHYQLNLTPSSLDLDVHFASYLFTNIATNVSGYTQFSGTSNPGGASPSNVIGGSSFPADLNSITTNPGSGGPKQYVTIDGFPDGSEPQIAALSLLVTDSRGSNEVPTTQELADILTDLGSGAEAFSGTTTGSLQYDDPLAYTSLKNSDVNYATDPLDIALIDTVGFTPGSPLYLAVDFSNENVDGISQIGVEDIAVVPEPATLSILALGGLGLLGRRRQRR